MKPPKRQESFLSAHPMIALALLLILLFAFGPSLLRAAANVLEHPFDCPAGEAPQGDRYDYCEPTTTP